MLEAASAADVPSAVATWLRANNLPQDVRSGEDAYLAALPWATEPTLQRHSGPAAPTDQVGLSHALAAIAETGTLALASGPDNPVTLNFVPESHIIVVEEKDLVGPYEDVWSRIRTRFGKTHMPRTLNFISGPSRDRRHRRPTRHWRARTAPLVRHSGLQLTIGHEKSPQDCSRGTRCSGHQPEFSFFLAAAPFAAAFMSLMHFLRNFVRSLPCRFLASASAEQA